MLKELGSHREGNECLLVRKEKEKEEREKRKRKRKLRGKKRKEEGSRGHYIECSDSR